MVGVEMDLGSILQNPGSLAAIPILLLVSLVVKLVPMLVFLKRLTWREIIADGFLLNTHLSIEIAIAVIGVRLGLLDAASSTLLILFALITVLIMPIVFNQVLPHDDGKERRTTIIFSGNQLGLQVARIMRDHDEDVIIFEPEGKNLEDYRKAGFSVVHVSHIENIPDLLSAEKIKALLALDSEDSLNLQVCRTAHHQGIPHIVALVNDASRLDEFRKLNVNVFAPALYRPALLALLARSPDIFRLLTTTTDDRDVQEVTITNPLMHFRRLYNLGLPGNLLVLAIYRDGESIIPHGRTSLQLGDRLTILGNLDDLRDVSLMFEN